MDRWELLKGSLTIVLLMSVASFTLAEKPGQEVRTLEGHRGSVIAVVFSPDGKELVSSSRDKTIKFWDPGTGKLERTLTGHTADVYSVVFSASGDLLASGSGDKTIRLWDPRSGKGLRPLRAYTNIVRPVAFSPDQKTLERV